MNIPNVLTGLRIILTFVFIHFLRQEGLSAIIFASFVFVLASLTDFFDGYLARKYHLISSFGKIMDPIADKFLMLAAFIGLGCMEMIPLWMVVIIGIREIGITLLRFWAINKGIVLAAESMGKWKTFAQILAVGIILIYIIVDRAQGAEQFLGYLKVGYLTLMWSAVILTVTSGISFLKNNKGIYE